ncbi:MAG: hypothetical protein Ct9H300mP14_02110 [Gammaproteobacteria bacterium]|nr:MAG: hypothetical protein Ct9H300mP14_02110 [Gammaproteobacteria bacterium]
MIVMAVYEFALPILAWQFVALSRSHVISKLFSEPVQIMNLLSTATPIVIEAMVMVIISSGIPINPLRPRIEQRPEVGDDSDDGQCPRSKKYEQHN